MRDARGHLLARSAKTLAILGLLSFLVSNWMWSGQAVKAWQTNPTDTPFPTETKENLVTATYNPLTPTVTPFPATPTKAEGGGGVGGQGGLVRQFYLPLVSRSNQEIPPTPTPMPTLTAPAPPPAALSRYMTTDNLDTRNYDALYAFGWQRGGCDGSPTPAYPNSFLILAFGRPWDNHTLTSAASVYGVALYPVGTVNVKLDTVERSLRKFIQGYYECVSQINPSASLTLGVGINSHQAADWLTFEHGRRWAQMIANLNAYIQIPPTWEHTITVAGAADFEPDPDWSPSAPVRQWVAGYASVFDSQYYFYGACSGCPAPTQDASGNYVANYTPVLVQDSDWTMDDVWYLSYGARPALPMPEIYETSGAHGRQWQNMADYAATCNIIPGTTLQCEPQRQGFNRNMYFYGAMTQYQACLDKLEEPQPQPCDPRLMNPPGAGWQQLWQALNDPNTPRTHQNGLRWSTDISWKR